MAGYLTGAPMVGVGALANVDTTALNQVGKRCYGVDNTGNTAEFIYLKGVASTIVGSVVTYDNVGATTLIVADASGPVAIAQAITVVSTFGWYGIQGTFTTDVVANSAAAATTAKNPGIEGATPGKVGDGRAAGDEINNFFQRTATTAAALVDCQIDHPFVNNFTGA